MMKGVGWTDGMALIWNCDDTWVLSATYGDDNDFHKLCFALRRHESWSGCNELDSFFFCIREGAERERKCSVLSSQY